MFGLGLVDNCLFSYTTMIFGMEFECKIVPAATRQFLEQTSSFIFLGSLAFFTMKTKADFRPYFIFFMILGIVSLLIILKVSKNFKKNDQDKKNELN